MSIESKQVFTGDNQRIATKPGSNPAGHKAMAVVSSPAAAVDTGPVSKPTGGASQPTQDQSAANDPASGGGSGGREGGTVPSPVDAGLSAPAVPSSGDNASDSGNCREAEVAIGCRPYRVTQSPDDLAEGPHYLTVNVLLNGRSFCLFEHFLRWKPEIDLVTDDQILVKVTGDSGQSGDVYKRLRTPELARRDAADAQIYRQRLREQESTRAAEIHVNIDIVNRSARRLNVDPDSLPCIVWSTYPDLSPPLLLSIKPSWYNSDHAAQRFLESFHAWLGEKHGADLFARRVTAGKARDWLIPLIKVLSKRIDTAVSERAGSKIRKRPGSGNVVTLHLERVGDEQRTKVKYGWLIISRRGILRKRTIGIRQFFYTGAFFALGKPRRIDGEKYLALSVDDLIGLLWVWHREKLRRMPPDDQRWPQHLIQKEWPQLKEQMDQIPELDGVFRRPWPNPNNDQTYYLLRIETVHLKKGIAGMNPDEVSQLFPNSNLR